jgi:D-alanyl-D-alanine carboxypeptidase
VTKRIPPARRSLPHTCRGTPARVYYPQTPNDRSHAVPFARLKTWRFRRRIAAINESLGIPLDHAQRGGLPLQFEARRLVSIGQDIYEREQRLWQPAAGSWRALVGAAREDGVELQLVSAYRSVDYQAGILRRKLERGQAIDEILAVSAAPGFSEHHSGRAVDLTTPGYPVLEEAFEDSEAFAWLNRHAGEFGFRLSYPRGNPYGVIYEPWHWAWWGDRKSEE